MATVKVIPPRTKRPERLRVAAYCRVSSDSADQLHSYATQIRSYTEYISQQDGWELVDIYADEGLTGTRIEQRTEFQRMMADCRRGKIDRILVKSISRFSRNTKDCLTALRELAKLGVTVKFEKENIDTGTLTTELMVSVSGSLAQQESISISQNQRMSYQRRTAKGEFITCYAPYGYMIRGKDLQIDQAQAKVVQEIFRWYLSGKGVEQIAEELTRQEIPTGFGKPVWSERAVRYILKNEKYIGDTLCQKTYSTDAFPFINRENHGERDQYYIENTHPSIISRSDFEKVQQLLKQKAERQHKAKGFYPLSRRMSCGKCGATLVRRESKSGYTCWVCKRYDEKRTLCEIGRIPETQIYAAFLRMYQKLKQYEEILLKPARKQLDDLRTAMQRKDPMILKLNQEIAERMEQEYKLSKLYSAGVLDMDAYMMRASEVQARVVKLKTMRRQRLKLEQLDEAAEMLQRVEDILQAGPDVLENFEIELFNSLVEKITTVSQNQIRFHVYGGIEVEEYLGGVKK